MTDCNNVNMMKKIKNEHFSWKHEIGELSIYTAMGRRF